MIRDMPKLDKPREKAQTYGVKYLTDAELIAILLRTGTRNLSSLDIARKIINEYGNLNNIDNSSPKKLSSIKGVGSTKAITILSALELGKRFLKAKDDTTFKANNSKSIYENMKYHFYKQKQEQFFVLFLNKNKKVLNIKRIYKGTNSLINIAPNEIFKEAYLSSSSNIVLVHNHPSGSTLPSKNDLIATERLIKAGKILGINVIDHLIITDDGYYSFYDNKDIKWFIIFIKAIYFE